MAQINAGRVRFVSRGEYNNTSQYFPLDLVNYNGNSYFAKENTTGILPTDTTKWQLIAEKGNIGPIGPTGATGNGIASITKTSTSGLVDTYTITYTNGTATTFQITNGEDGEVTQAQLDETNREVDYYKSTLNALPKVEGQGTSLTLDDTAEAPMKMSLAPSAVEQETTTGKNLFSGGNNIQFTKSISIHLEKPIPAGTYTFSSIVTSSDTDDTRNLIQFRSDESGTQTKSISLGRNTRNSASTTTTFETNYIVIYASTNNAQSTGDTATIKETQIENGSSMTDYEPYTNGASPNPDYPQDIHTISGDNEIKVENINLWDEKWEIGGYNTTTGIKDTSQDKTSNKYPISCEPSTQYYICINNNESSNAIRLLYYDRNMNFISTVAGNRNTIITTPANTYYMNIMCTVAYGTTYKNDICINTSNASINGNYYPHQEQSLPLNLPVENLIGGFDYSRTNNGISFTHNYNGSILASGTSTNYATSIGVNAISANNWFKTLLPGVYTLSGGVNDNIGLQLLDENNTLLASSFTSSETFTITQKVNTYLRAYVNTGVTLNLIIKPQLEKGTKANSYRPYGTPALEYCKIGNYEDEFVIPSGSNIFNVEKWVNSGNNSNYYSYSNGVLSIDAVDTRTTSSFTEGDKIYLENGNYYLSNIGNAGIRVYPDLETVVSTNQFEVTNGYIYLKLVSNSVMTCEPMINKGTTALPYEPYNNGKWYLKKNVGKVVLNGSEEWNENNSGTNTYRFALSDSYFIAQKQGYCNNNNYVTSGVSNDVQVVGKVGGLIYFRINKTTIDTLTGATPVEKFENWLSNNNSICYAPIITPEYILLNDTLQSQLTEIYKWVKAYQEQTNISQVNNDLSFVIKVSAVYDLNKLLARVVALEEE